MPEKLEQLKQVVEDILSQARSQGASAAEAGVSATNGIATTVRLGETETIEHNSDNGMGITVYFGQRKGSASTTDLSPEAIKQTVEAACHIARFTTDDPYSGLANAEEMLAEQPDLDLYHPWDITVDQAIDLALACETAALETDSRIQNSEGASLNTARGFHVYGNSHGFLGAYPSTRHSLSCSVLAQDGNSMQRDYWYDTSRLPEQLATPESIGKKTAERTLARLNPRKLKTRTVPVIFRSDVAPSLLRSFINAIRGSSLYRKSTFMLDKLGQQVFPEHITISENPLLAQGLGSSAYDSDGVATRARKIVENGILNSYVLDAYSSRKLGMANTGNAGGVRNLSISQSDKTFDDLLREMQTGLVVTEMMGQGVNPVTGDYSRGAAGFWVENGEIQYPVDEITIAGNLRDMFSMLSFTGNDTDNPGSIKT
ncbi:MAG: metalloprotease PmbA, partial [Gammaproteobacteria bacterium]|nr:metalloprotease PmbA [Gammaproteobacteria bacterium]